MLIPIYTLNVSKSLAQALCKHVWDGVCGVMFFIDRVTYNFDFNGSNSIE